MALLGHRSWLRRSTQWHLGEQSLRPLPLLRSLRILPLLLWGILSWLLRSLLWGILSLPLLWRHLRVLPLLLWPLWILSLLLWPLRILSLLRRHLWILPLLLRHLSLLLRILARRHLPLLLWILSLLLRHLWELSWRHDGARRVWLPRDT